MLNFKQKQVMNNFKIKIRFIVGSLLAISIMLSLFSCEKEQGTPVINNVTALTDTASLDSTIVGAGVGTYIAIYGQNFGGLQHVYFNDAEVYVNTAFITDSYIVLEVPDGIPLKGTDPSAPNIIRVVTDHGECSYNFLFYSPAVSSEIVFVPIGKTLNEGDTIIIYGSNFYEVNEILFVIGTDTINASYYLVDSSTYASIRVVIPEGANAEGEIIVSCVNGSGSCSFFTSVEPPVIYSYSSEYPVPGETITITGKNFVLLQNVTLPDGSEVASDDITVNSSRTELSFVVPQNAYTSGSITVETVFGTGQSDTNFYAAPNMFLDLDSKGWKNWGQVVVGTVSSSSVPYTGIGNVSHITGSPGLNWWWEPGVLASGITEWPTNIPDNTPIGNIELRFSFYTSTEWTEREFELYLANFQATYNWKPWETATVKTGAWQTVSINMSLFTYAGSVSTYADFKAQVNTSEAEGSQSSLTNPIVYMIRYTKQSIDWYLDNFRFVVVE
jgi:hypothetical protein